MPILFRKDTKIKVIEYGEHADDGFSFESIKRFFRPFFQKLNNSNH